jgi:hypothetical protein
LLVIFFDFYDLWKVIPCILRFPIKSLLEVGFEYVTEMDGKKIFRKRK